MKHVFVETNFLIAVARPLPHRSAMKLWEQHKARELILHIPWCAVTEARRTMERIINDDLGFDREMLDFARREFLPGDKATLAVLQASPSA